MKRLLNIPEEFEIGIMIAIGYQDTYDVLPESLVKKASIPRERGAVFVAVEPCVLLSPTTN
jgi:hypothetical protein